MFSYGLLKELSISVFHFTNMNANSSYFCRNGEMFQIRISDIDKSCDKISIRNHRVPLFVIRVLCLNTLYAKGYFFPNPIF